MVVVPSRKEKDEPNALLHNQAGLPMHQGEAEQRLCRAYADRAVHSAEDSSIGSVLLPWHRRVRMQQGGISIPSH